MNIPCSSCVHVKEITEEDSDHVILWYCNLFNKYVEPDESCLCVEEYVIQDDEEDFIEY